VSLKFIALRSIDFIGSFLADKSLFLRKGNLKGCGTSFEVSFAGSPSGLSGANPVSFFSNKI